MSNYRYSDSFPYSAEHVTYSGVPTSAAPGLGMRVTVLGQDVLLLQNRLETLKESLLVLQQKLLVLRESSNYLVSRLEVAPSKLESIENLQARVSALREEMDSLLVRLSVKKQSFKALGARLSILNKQTVLLNASVGVIFGAASKSLILRLLVLNESSSLLRTKVSVLRIPIHPAGTTSSGKVTVKFKEYKAHHALVSVSAKKSLKGVVVCLIRGSIRAVGGRILRDTKSEVRIGGSVLKGQVGEAELSATCVNRISGHLNSTGGIAAKRLGYFNCRGITVNAVRNEIILSGQKDVFPALVALNLLNSDAGVKI